MKKDCYIFVSYAHKDADAVYPVIERMKRDGYAVWYDSNIKPGTKWDDNIAEHIKECAFFLAFVSKQYLSSTNCKDELDYARDLDKRILLVYLEEATLASGMAMRMNRYQAVMKYKCADDREFYRRLYDADGLSLMQQGSRLTAGKSDAECKRAAKAFAEYWRDRGDEKSDCQSFWLALLRDVLGVAEPEKVILFEERVRLDHTSFIDGHIPATHVLIEQKKKGLNLRAPIRQSDGTLLSPFQQAQRYSAALPYSMRPRFIITCNFEEFLIYDMEKPTGEPESILLYDLPKEYYRLAFLVEEKSELLHREEQISIRAGELVGRLYDALLKQYINPDDKASLHSLNILCVRLVFCLYAEDAGIFGDHNIFHRAVLRH